MSESVKAAASEAASFKEAGFKAVKIKVMLVIMAVVVVMMMAKVKGYDEDDGSDTYDENDEEDAADDDGGDDQVGLLTPVEFSIQVIQSFLCYF